MTTQAALLRYHKRVATIRATHRRHDSAATIGLIVTFGAAGLLIGTWHSPRVVHVIEHKTEYLVQVKEVSVARGCPESMHGASARVWRGPYSNPNVMDAPATRTRSKAR